MNNSPDFPDKQFAPETATVTFPSSYEFRVNGRLTDQGASWFEELAITIDEEVKPAQTIIRGQIVDQAALYGLISRVRDLGLTLVSVQRVEIENEEEEEEEEEELE